MKWNAVFTGQTGYPQPAENHQWLTETYKPGSFCPTCSIGKIQSSPFFFLSEPNAKHSQFIGLNWVFDEIFVSNQVRSIFEDRRITGVEYVRPLKLKDKTELTSIWQLKVTERLSEPALTTNLLEERCEMPRDKSLIRFLRAQKSKLVEGPFCGQSKHNIPKDRFIFKSTAFLDVPDIVKTLDWFGSGASSNQIVIFSDTVRKIVEDFGWRGITFLPVDLV